MKLQKLVYFAHGWHLGLKGTPLVDEPVQAWPYGPVFPSLYHEFKHFGNGEIGDYATELNWGDATTPTGFHVVVPTIPAEDRYVQLLLRKIWEMYGPATPVKLSNATHEPGTPWEQVNREHGGQIPKGTIISEGIIRKHFGHLAGGVPAASV